jgi:hypothetical protein
VLAADPVHLENNGGIVRKVSSSLLIDEIFISPYIPLTEAIAIRDLIVEICPFLSLKKVKISSLLDRERPEMRENLYWIATGVDFLAGGSLDPLINVDKEKDQKGEVQPLPKITLEV